MNFDVLLSEINLTVIDSDKIRVEPSDLVKLLSILKNNPEFDFDMLFSITAVDLVEKFALIYDLYSTNLRGNLFVSVEISAGSPQIYSVVEIFKSAHFDECEIFDMFGIKFINNDNLERLYMPSGWIGHPLRKDYKFVDNRLMWGKTDA